MRSGFSISSTELKAVSNKVVLNKDGYISIATNGKIYSGKTSYSDAAKGWYLGDDSGVPKFKVGYLDSYIGYDGTDAVLGRDSKLIGADAYNNNSIYWATYFDSADAFYKYVTGSASANVSSTFGALVLSTYATTEIASIERRFFAFNVSLTFAKKSRFKTVVDLSGLSGHSSGEFFLGTGDRSDDRYGFAINSTNDNLWVDTSNTATKNLNDTGIALSTLTAGTILEAVFSTSNVKYYVNGVLKVTVTINLPTIAYTRMLSIYSRPVKSSSTIKIYQFKFQQDE